MLTRIGSRLTYANVMATIGVFLALSGGAYAAAKLPKNSVGSAQIKKSAVTSAKVKDGSLASGDFQAGQLPAGPQGPQGLKGDRGVEGPRGADGNPAQFPQTLPSGRTETGVFGIRFTAAGPGVNSDDSIAFPLPLAAAPSPVLGPSATCTGTATNPTAPAGVLCVYFGQESNILQHDVTDASGNAANANKFGAVVDVQSAAGNTDTLARGSWAVTAP
jgi:hypothetical protein